MRPKRALISALTSLHFKINWNYTKDSILSRRVKTAWEKGTEGKQSKLKKCTKALKKLSEPTKWTPQDGQGPAKDDRDSEIEILDVSTVEENEINFHRCFNCIGTFCSIAVQIIDDPVYVLVYEFINIPFGCFSCLFSARSLLLGRANSPGARSSAIWDPCTQEIRISRLNNTTIVAGDLLLPFQSIFDVLWIILLPHFLSFSPHLLISHLLLYSSERDQGLSQSSSMSLYIRWFGTYFHHLKQKTIQQGLYEPSKWRKNTTRRLSNRR